GADMLIQGGFASIPFLAGGDERLVAMIATSQAVALAAPVDSSMPEDLVGGKLGTKLGSAYVYADLNYPEANGIDESEVELVNLDDGSQPPALINGDVDAILGFLQIAARAAEHPDFELLDTFRSDIFLTASNALVTEEPDAVEGVLRALIR